MISSTASEAREYFLNTRRSANKRTPTSALDYGDDATVMLHLKRIGSSIADTKEDNYGMYLGCHSSGYVVAIKNFIGSDFIGCEVFETINDMKSTWQLD